VTPLSAAAALEAWEAGRAQHPVDRALTLLLGAEPGASRAELAALPVAERDRRLLRLRVLLQGPVLEAFAACPACGERLEARMDAGELGLDAPPSAGPWRGEVGATSLVFRLPDSRDLAAACAAGDVEAGRRALAAACVLEARRGEAPVDPRELSEKEVDGLAALLEAAAPDAEVVLAMSCPACGHGWSALLDPGAFLWTEVSARARRTLLEVDALARAYGWSEREILALSPERRRSYLEIVGG
jgi:hypothetical protein